MKKTKTIVDRIKESKVKQRPKWYFTLIHILNWFFYSICILLGGAAFSVILFSIQQTDFDLTSHLSHSNWEFIFGLLPFFWIIILLIFLVLAMVIVRRSKKGYKYNWLGLLGLSTVISILLGTIFFIGGGGQKLENLFIENVSNYQSVNENKIKVWMRPEAGYLAGTITTINEKGLIVTDFNNFMWQIDYSNASISNHLVIKEGEKVKLIGKVTKLHNFYVKEMRPWNGRTRQYNNQNRRERNEHD